jgi:hypothetical protein
MSARRPRRALVLAAIALVALAVAEAGARWIAARSWRPLPPFGEHAVQREWLERSERELAAGAEAPGYSRFDAVLGWTTRPGHVSRDGRIHVNAQGLRATRDHAALPAPGVRRVLACGESFTFGEEVADADVWCARLEAHVPDLEVLNYGVGGYGTDQALLRLEREGRGPAEAVLVGLLLENIGRNVNRYRPLWYPLSQPAAKPRYRATDGGLVLVPQPFATHAEFVAAVRSGAVLERLAEHEHWSASPLPAWLEWSAAARLVGARSAYAARASEPLWTDTDGEPFVTTIALLAGFRDAARALGIERVLVVVFPTKADLRRELEGDVRFWTTLHAALAARGIECVDTTDALAEEARRSGLDALWLESHFSALGNDVVARAVAGSLQGGAGAR